MKVDRRVWIFAAVFHISEFQKHSLKSDETRLEFRLAHLAWDQTSRAVEAPPKERSPCTTSPSHAFAKANRCDQLLERDPAAKAQGHRVNQLAKVHGDSTLAIDAVNSIDGADSADASKIALDTGTSRSHDLLRHSFVETREITLNSCGFFDSPHNTHRV